MKTYKALFFTIISKLTLYPSRWKNVLLDMLHKAKDSEINRDLVATGYDYT